MPRPRKPALTTHTTAVGWCGVVQLWDATTARLWWCGGGGTLMEISKYGRYIHLLLWTGLSHQAPREEQTRSLGGDARNILQDSFRLFPKLVIILDNLWWKRFTYLIPVKMHFNDINKDSFEKLLVKVRFNVGQSLILLINKIRLLRYSSFTIINVNSNINVHSN